MWEALARALGTEIVTSRSIAGGDINEAFRVQTRDGRDLFVKTNAKADPAMFDREANGLRWLAEARAIRIPEVVASGPRFLALEWIEPGRAALDYDERLGRGLAALHRAGADHFGFYEDNFIGWLPQDNTAEPDWPAFFRERRLGPQLREAERRGHASSSMRRGFERLFASLETRLGPAEPPSRVHGDLWGGNRHTAPDGSPVLIDPAVYGGHREMDLAMMRLFGGFSRRVFDAYEEAFPLAPDSSARVPIYQLYPLMTHVNLFGGHYISSVERILDQVA